MAVDDRTNRLWEQVRALYGVNGGYYPGVNLDDLPRGPFTEMANVCAQLEEQGIPCTPENVHQTMEARRQILQLLRETEGLKGKVEDLSKGKVGFTGDPLFYVAILLTPFVLFGKGFFTRLGQRLGDRVFDYLTREQRIPEEEAREVAEALVEIDYDSRKAFLKYRRERVWKR